ncbi:MAG: FlgD immunoglobulin-like domain containing protein, partial [bacterium]
MSKKLLLFAVTIVIMGFFVTATSSHVYANVFASDIKVVNPGGAPFDGDLSDGTPGVGIVFRLNENATSVVITVSDAGNNIVATIDAGPHPQGLSMVTWSGIGDDGNPVPEGDYTFTVTANDSKGHDGFDIIYARSGTVIFTRGGTSIRNPAAPNFGHPIGGNGGGGGLKRGPLNFFADGTGFQQVEPNLSRFSPFDVRDHGGLGRLYMITSDDDGQLYYSDRLDPLSKLYTIAPSLDASSLAVVTTSDDSSKKGHGIDVVGTGANRTIYWGLANTIVRAAIGADSTFDPANFELIADFEPDTTAGDTNAIFIKDIVIDDSGYMYVALRRGREVDGINPGLAVERYDISGTLPVTRADRQWTVPVGFDNGNGRPIGFGLDRGDDLTTNTDDRIYFSNAAGSPPGGNPWNSIHKIDDLATGGSTMIFEDISGSGSTSSRADMTVDAAGNLIWFENSSEWLIALSPPDGPNSFTTPANDVISITDASTANAFPHINAVRDVPNDQGNQVLVSWAGSAMDRYGMMMVDRYEVYRKLEAPAQKSS